MNVCITGANAGTCDSSSSSAPSGDLTQNFGKGGGPEGTGALGITLETGTEGTGRDRFGLVIVMGTSSFGRNRFNRSYAPASRQHWHVPGDSRAVLVALGKHGCGELLW